MELKDWLYLLGLIISLGLGVFSIYLNFKNRKNGLREHLYKEQVSFFFKLTGQFTAIYNLFEDIMIEEYDIDEYATEIENKIKELHTIVDTHDFIIPDEVYAQINITIKSIDKVYDKALQVNGKIEDELLTVFSNNQIELNEEIRDYIGMEKLTGENKKVF